MEKVEFDTEIMIEEACKCIWEQICANVEEKKTDSNDIWRVDESREREQYFEKAIEQLLDFFCPYPGPTCDYIKSCNAIRKDLEAIQKRHEEKEYEKKGHEAQLIDDGGVDLEQLQQEFFPCNMLLYGEKLKKRTVELSQSKIMKAWKKVLTQIDNLLLCLKDGAECSKHRITYHELSWIFVSDLEIAWKEKTQKEREDLAEQCGRNIVSIKGWVAGKNFPARKRDLIIFLIEMDMDVDSANRYLQIIGDREELYSLNVDEYVLMKILQYNKTHEERISGEEAFECIVRVRRKYINYLIESMVQEHKQKDKNFFYLISCYQALSLQLRNERNDLDTHDRRGKISGGVLDRMIEALLDKKHYINYQETEKAAEAFAGQGNLLKSYEMALSEERSKRIVSNGYYKKEWEWVGKSCVNYLRNSGNDAVVKAFDEVSIVSEEERIAREIRELTLFMRRQARKEELENSFPVEQLWKQESGVDTLLETWLQNYGGLFMFEWIGRQYACLEICKEIEALKDNLRTFCENKLNACIPGKEKSGQLSSMLGEYGRRRMPIRRRDYLKLLLLLLTEPATGKEGGASELLLDKEEHGAMQVCNRYLARAHFAPLSFQICQDAFLQMCLWAMHKYHNPGKLTANACEEMIKKINDAIERRYKIKLTKEEINTINQRSKKQLTEDKIDSIEQWFEKKSTKKEEISAIEQWLKKILTEEEINTIKRRFERRVTNEEKSAWKNLAFIYRQDAPH